MGVGESGAADRGAHDSANRLVGNHPAAATLEVTAGGLAVRAVGAMTVAVTGARVPVVVNGETRPDYSTLRLASGDILELGHPSSGLRSYLAVRGGIDVPAELGSRSTDTRSGTGPAPVATGDQLLIGAMETELPSEEQIPPPVPSPDPAMLRVRLGSDESFTPASVAALLHQIWIVTASDRVSTRLKGPGPLHRAHRDEPRATTITTGTAAVTPHGEPVLYLADHPVTSEDPMIAVVVEADLGTVAQLEPGHRVRFTPAR